MIVLRMARDIRRHFPIRVPEWIMAGVLLAWSLMLSADPSTFAKTRDFSELAAYGDELFWSTVCLAVALLRLIALVVNGTFHQFRFAPHLRCVASFIACVFWGQITLGVFAAWLSDAPGTGIAAHLGFMAFEGWNLFRASADAEAGRRGR